MQKIGDLAEVKEPLRSAVICRADYKSYIDMEDIENEHLKIVRWAKGADFFIECDAWIPFQFKHLFNPDTPSDSIPFIQNSSYPRGFYYRVVRTLGENIDEIVCLPSGLISKSSGKDTQYE